MASSLEVTESLVRLCEAEGVTLGVNYSRAWDPSLNQIIADLKAGHFGKIRAVQAIYNKGILNNGSHLIDLLYRCFDNLELQNVFTCVNDFDEKDPSIGFVLQAQNAIPITVTVAHAADFALFELSFITEKAVLSMEQGGLNWRVREVVASELHAGYRVLNAGQITPSRYLETMCNAMDDVYKNLSTAAPFLSTGQTALRVHQMCESIRQKGLLL